MIAVSSSIATVNQALLFFRRFRVIKAREYLDNFSSDRKHMLDADGKWLKPPPEWPCIFARSGENESSNLSLFRKSTKSQDCDNFMDKISEVFDFSGFVRNFM